MSTPTSMTVVATSTSRAPARNSAMTRSFSAEGSWPCSRPTRRPASSAPARRSASATTEVAWTRSEPSTRGQTTKARWPAATSWRTRDQASSASSGVRSHRVTTGCRPGGSSSMMVMSRSPKTTMAAVRGMGVAVMTRRSGSRPVAVLAAALGPEGGPLLHAEAVLLVDDHHPEGREAHPVGQAGHGCRPGCRRCRRPGRRGWRCARRHRSGWSGGPHPSGRWPSRVAGSGTVSPASRRRTSSACCSARTSVGAMRAAWWPPWVAVSMAASGHHRLARPDVPLEQAVHGQRSGQVGADGRPWPPAGPGSAGRADGRGTAAPAPALRPRLVTGPVDDVADAPGVTLEPGLAEDQGQLQSEQLVEGQPAAGRLGLVHGGRAVDVVEGGGPVDQPEPVPPRPTPPDRRSPWPGRGPRR